jgi:hypothetical protein
MSSFGALRARRRWPLAALTALAVIWTCTVEANARSGARQSNAGDDISSARTVTVRAHKKRDGTVVREHKQGIPDRGGAKPAVELPIRTVEPSSSEGLWDLGGSLLYLSVEGNRRKFLYEEPRKGMSKRGVGKSTVYFDGELDGRSLRGTAHAFFPNCGPIGYPVTGELSPDGRQIKLRGKTPQANAQCQIVDERDREMTLVYRGPREGRCKQTGPSVVICQ